MSMRRLCFILALCAFLAGCTIEVEKPPSQRASSDASPTTNNGDLARPPSTDDSQPMTQATDAASATPLIPRARFFGNPEKARARLSSDGKRLAYLAPVDGVLNVWVGPVDDVDAAKPVTKDTHRGIVNYF